jgi:hypothetical protein
MQAQFGPALIAVGNHDHKALPYHFLLRTLRIFVVKNLVVAGGCPVLFVAIYFWLKALIQSRPSAVPKPAEGRLGMLFMPRPT